jgi:hypothetical protein
VFFETWVRIFSVSSCWGGKFEFCVVVVVNVFLVVGVRRVLVTCRVRFVAISFIYVTCLFKKRLKLNDILDL